jgi:hypothetical protein
MAAFILGLGWSLADFAKCTLTGLLMFLNWLIIIFKVYKVGLVFLNFGKYWRNLQYHKIEEKPNLGAIGHSIKLVLFRCWNNVMQASWNLAPKLLTITSPLLVYKKSGHMTIIRLFRLWHSSIVGKVMWGGSLRFFLMSTEEECCWTYHTHHSHM